MSLDPLEPVPEDLRYLLVPLLGVPYRDYRSTEAGYAGAPAWAIEEPVLADVRQDGAHCVGLLNLILWQLGAPKRVRGTMELWKIMAPWRRPFRDEEPGDGDLLLRAYDNEEDQGHVAIVLDHGELAHCYWTENFDVARPMPQGLGRPGVAIDKSWRTSHAWDNTGYYQARVPFQDWIDWAFLLPPV